MDYDAVADLPIVVEDWDLSLRERDTSSGFTRTTTVIALHGEGVTGRGEDVTYETDDHHALADHDLGLAIEDEFDGVSAYLGSLSLFPDGPTRAADAHYRRWGFESAALDLALRQASTDLGSVLARTYDPLRFVVSTRLGDPPTVERVRELLATYPDTEFKLDPTPEWSPELVDELAAIADVRILDLKGHYEGTSVDVPPDPDLYDRLVRAFPEAILEDPALTEATESIVDGVRDRISWDAPITDVDSVRDLPFEPEWLNIKPSRFGTVESLFDTLAYCDRRGIDCYGGGQFELDVGRTHVQRLAALFYPNAPNDVAPADYNDPAVERGLPTSPLPLPESDQGL